MTAYLKTVKKSAWSESYITTLVDNLNRDYGSSISGVYIRNPGSNGFMGYTWYSSVFSHIRSYGYKIGIEVYNTRYTLSLVKQVDLVVTFRDDIEYFNSNCGVHGIGVFCRNTLVTEAEYNEMYSAMQSGEISRDMFSAMIWYVLETRLGAFSNTAPGILS